MDKLSNRSIRIDGIRCRELRMRLGLTREVMAGASRGEDALSVATIKRAELGQPIYPGSAAALARHLGISLEELLPKQRPRLSRGPQTRAAEPIGRAAVIVLPLEVLDARRVTKSFANVMTTEVTHQLVPYGIPVITRSECVIGPSRRPFNMGPMQPSNLLVQGCIRAHANRMRINMSLLQATTGTHVWTKSYEATSPDALRLQTALAVEIASDIAMVYLAAEGNRVARIHPDDLDLGALQLRSFWCLHRASANDSHEARTCARRVLETDPTNAVARSVLVLSHYQDLLRWPADARTAFSLLVAESREFERVMPSEPMMYVATAHARVAEGDWKEARLRLERALVDAPHYPRARMLFGQVLGLSEGADRSSCDLEPLQPWQHPAMWTMMLQTSVGHFAARRYDAAITWARRAVVERPQIPMSHAALAAALVQQGDMDSARVALQPLREHGLRNAQGSVQAMIGNAAPSVGNLFIDSLRAAGLRR